MRTQGADQACAHARELHRKNFGANSALLSALLSNEGALRLEQGRFAQAIADGQEAEALAVKATGAESPLVAQALAVRGAALERQGNAGEGAGLLERAVAMIERTRSANDIDLISPLIALSAARNDLKGYGGALASAERATALLGRGGPDPGQGGWASFQRARALKGLHRDAEAAELAGQARAQLAALPWKAPQLKAVEAWLAKR